MRTRTQPRSKHSACQPAAALGRSVWGALLLCAVIALGAVGCKNPDAILIRATADQAVEQIAIFIYDDMTRQLVFDSGWTKTTVDGEKNPRDISKNALKIALKLSQKGDFTVMMIGAIGPVESMPVRIPTGTTQFFWAGHVKVTGTEEIRAHLFNVPATDDLDRDLWPSATTWPTSTPAAGTEFATKMDLLDCYDADVNNPKIDSNNRPVDASKIHPFAKEICGDGIDEACNDNGDEKCEDKDADGDPSGTDCDDNDATRHNPTAADPYPDPPNCCGYNLGFAKGTTEGKTNYTGNAMLCPMTRCGDGIDNSCKGVVNNVANDTKCVVDNDCDGFSPPADCDDNDPNSYPGAPEPCGGTKDLNCSGMANDGCVPCDLDGDGYQRNDTANGCPNADNKNPGKFDCNDYDSGVFPSSTSTTLPTRTSALGGSEGGTPMYATKTESALRGYCRRAYEPTGVGTPRVGSFGQTPGDFDCDGVAYKDCPTMDCDADGDGFPNGNPGCKLTDIAVDCNDNDPTVYPFAPDKCGDGILQNCSADTACAGDTDGDGYTVAEGDCGEGDATRHPFAVELCNGIDDDCDGLVDEGNPDATGKPLVEGSAVTACTDSDVGECGKTKGTCVCSASDPVSTKNAGMRDACPTELTATGGNKDKCFAAGQPHQQSCNPADPKDDDCDGRVDAPDGVNLAILGQTCGTDTGECRIGTVTGCNMGQTSCFSVLGGEYNPWIVCSAEAICPIAELCNGKDDDCNGGLPTDEQDIDGDNWLACAGCGDVSTLATGKVGCGDCADNTAVGGVAAANIHPTATDVCNGVDDNCSNGLSDDGENCPTGTAGAPGGHAACCGSTPACKDLFASSETTHCTACNNTCDPSKADRCSPTGCVCGNTGAACGGTDNCTNANSEIRCRKQNGGTCTLGNECLSNNCVDGFCCNAPCTGQCERCDATPGTCTQTVGAPNTNNGTGDPDQPKRSPCTDTDGDSCDGTCDATGGRNVCHYFGTPQGTNLCPGASCQSSSVQRNPVTTCNNNGDCSAQTTTNCAAPVCACSGVGAGRTCATTTNTCKSTSCTNDTPVSCGDFVCNGGGNACLTSCTTDADCVKSGVAGQKRYCDTTDGQCKTTMQPGRACTDGAGACRNGTCLTNCCDASPCSANVCITGVQSNQICAAGTGACTTQTMMMCDQYKCNGTSTCFGAGSCGCGSNAPCDEATHCISSAYCSANSSGNCLDKKANGADCTPSTTDGDQCESGICADGKCCNASCGPCGSCASGTCALVGDNGTPGESGCGLYLCDGASAACPGAGSCSTDADCVASAYCDGSKNCVARTPAGGQCSGPASTQCVATHPNCAGPALNGNYYCCATACGAAITCDPDLTDIASSQTCQGTGACHSNGATNCAGNGSQYCQAGTGCVSDLPAGSACTDGAQCVTSSTCRTNCCTSSSACTGACLSGQCDGTGACGAAPPTTPCGTGNAFACSGSTTCPTNCTSDTNCASGFYCGKDAGTNGQCKARIADGANCDSNDCEGSPCQICQSVGRTCKNDMGQDKCLP